MGLFSKDIASMEDLFVHTLRDIYYAEKQILKSLPEMIEKASDPALKQAFQTHLGETKNHVTRVEQVFKMHGVDAKIVFDLFTNPKLPRAIASDQPLLIGNGQSLFNPRAVPRFNLTLNT